MISLEDIYKKYYSIIFKYLMSLTKNTDLSEELTQETFYKMIKKINTYNEKSKFVVWLCEIAKNTYYDYLRKNKKILIKYEINENLASNSNVENDYIEKEEIENTYKKIDKLDEKTKKVIYLRLNSELSFKEIGEIFGKTETWARVTFYRGKQKLKEDHSYGE